MTDSAWFAVLAVSLHVLLQVGLAVRVILHPHRDPASRIAWLAVIFAMPVAGLVIYTLFGEVNIGRLRVERRGGRDADAGHHGGRPARRVGRHGRNS